MVKLSTLLSAVFVLTADAFRSAVTEHDKADSAWDFNAVQAGQDPNGPLIPALVPPANTTFEVQNREALDFLESNEYHWAFISIGQGFNWIPVNQWFARLQGSFFGNIFGKRRTEITNNMGKPLFIIEMNKYTWDPTRLRWSWRIRNPISDEILFTINKDIIGAGFLGLRDEWRVFRGRKRQRDQIYHIIGAYHQHGYRVYRTKEDWSVNRPPVAEASKHFGRSVLDLPDVYSLQVHEGEDTALLLAATVVMDMAHEAEERARERQAHHREMNHMHSLLQGEIDADSNMWADEEGFPAEVWSEEAMAAAEAKPFRPMPRNR